MQQISTEHLLENHELTAFTGASVFGAISENTILWLLENGRLLAASEGEHLFSPGEPGNSFHVILDGQVSYYKFHEGQFAYIREYCAGEQIGFMSLIALHERVGRAEAHAGTVTLEIDSALFHQFHDHAPDEFGILMINLAREMARTLRSVDNLVVEKSRA